MKLDILPTIVHCCCVLHNILFASEEWTLDQILNDCHLPHVQEDELTSIEDGDLSQLLGPMGFVSKESISLERKMTQEDLLDYLVHIQNTNYMSRHPDGPRR